LSGYLWEGNYEKIENDWAIMYMDEHYEEIFMNAYLHAILCDKFDLMFRVSFEALRSS
jgi:hypothetical protein